MGVSRAGEEDGGHRGFLFDGRISKLAITKNQGNLRETKMGVET
jgi:hypothetical protein